MSASWRVTLMLGIIALFHHTTTAVSIDDPNHGIIYYFPTGGETFYYQDTLNVSYQSPFPLTANGPLLYTFCVDPATGALKAEPRLDRVPPYNGSALIPLNFTDTTLCYFNLRPNTTAGLGSNGQKWNLIGQARPTPLTLGVTATATASASASTTATTTTTTTSSSANSSTTADSGSGGSGGLSVGAQAGIGVGVAAVVLVFAALNIWLCMRRRGRSGNQGPTTPGTDAGLPSGMSQGPASSYGHQSSMYQQVPSFVGGGVDSSNNSTYEQALAKHQAAYYQPTSPQQLSTTEVRAELGDTSPQEMPTSTPTRLQ